MKRIILALIICSVIIVGISAEVVVSSMTKQTSMDKQLRDYLLTKIPTMKDAQGREIVKEIKPAITIECADRTCKYSAVQSGIISSYDNVIDRVYCEVYNNNTCEKQATYTTAQIEDMVSSAVTQRLSDYANQSIKEGGNAYVKTSEGTLTITQK